ncbi:MAG: methyltransferase [Calditrichales bacterium]|nr:MAG: methyltransferase [Calditrichales bacterium]
MITKWYLFCLIFSLLISLTFPGPFAQENPEESKRDQKVRTFLDSRHDQWRDMNVPEADGEKLYQLIIEHNYTRALEIGTSTGHSGIWIAWALRKTGGKLITIEIDADRHREAVDNFNQADLADVIDARLADAHQLVEELPGPFDFVFSDADKDWYINYFKAVFPKLEDGGCFTAHNISDSGWSLSGTTQFYELIKNHPQMETTLFKQGSGLSISFKRATKQSDP